MLDSVTDTSGGIRIAEGRYVLGPRLGGGGTSDVYRAVDTVLRRPVAVKLFRACSDHIAECRFQAEAQHLAPLAHPGLVTIHDTGVEDGRAYQVLQLIDGTTLRDRLFDGTLEPRRVMEIGARLAEALAYIHQHGVVHRDVKPSNVLDDGDEVYLADFGSSRLVDDAHLTVTGLAIGTAAYMAPEQVRGLDVGPAADVYSLGLVLLECLTGHREYPGSATESAVARLSRPPLVPTSLPAPFPSLLAAMTLEDADRRPSAQECAAILSERTGRVSAAEPSPGHAETPRSPVKSLAEVDDTDSTDTLPALRVARPTNHWRLGCAALSVVLMILIGALALSGGHAPESTPGNPRPAATTTPTASPTDSPTPVPASATPLAKPGSATPASNAPASDRGQAVKRDKPKNENAKGPKGSRSGD